MPVAGQPLLEYWLALLAPEHIDRILVNVHHLPGMVERWVAHSPYAERVQLVHEPTLLNTGGTVLANREFACDQALMVVHADNLSHFDVAAFLARHRSRPAGCEMTMMTFTTDSPSSCGIVELDAQGVVQHFHEKVESPPGNIANGAVYIVESTLFDYLDSLGRKEIDFSLDVIPHFLGRIATFHNSQYHRDIGTLDSLLLAQFEYPLRVRQRLRNPFGMGVPAAMDQEALDEFVAALASEIARQRRRGSPHP
jgi:mannose-1-phosphate guanylyltransferase